MAEMTRTDAIHVIAGTLILIGTLGVLFHSIWWLLLTGFVGLNLLQFGFSGFCPALSIMRKLKLFKE